METTNTINSLFSLIGFILFIGLIVWGGSHLKKTSKKYQHGKTDILDTISDPSYSASIGNNFHDDSHHRSHHPD
jgi:hypothetical protein